MRGSSRPQHEGAAGDAKGSRLGAPSATMDALAGAEGPSAEAEALAPAVTRNMGAPFHDMHEMGGSKGHRYLDPGTQAMRSHRSLRGVARRALHAAGVQHDESIFSQPPANATLAQQPDTPPPPPEDTSESGKYGILLTVICFVILAPCLLAAVAQTVHCWRKRRRDRVERELLAVSTNPTSRMLVLSEIFKNDSRPVTEDDASPKKKRVQVKRHRKKTAAERQAIREDAGSGEVSSDEDEEMGGWSGGDDQRPMIVYVSSFEHLESQHEVAGDEHTTGRSIQEEHIPNTPITQTSDNNSSNVTEDASVGSEQQLEKKEEEATASSACDREECEEKPFAVAPQPLGTEIGEDLDKAPKSKAVDNNEQEPITDAKSEEDRDGAPQVVLLAPKIPSIPGGGANEQDQKSSKSSPSDADMQTDSALDIPVLAIAGAHPDRSQSISPRPMLGDSTASPSTPLQFMPDLSDEDSDDGVAVGRADRGSIFRANSEDGDGIPGIHGCGSSVTEVTSNVEMLKDTGTGTSSFDDVKLEPLHTNPTKGESPAALYPPYQLETANSTSSNPSGLGAPVPIKSVESFRTGTSSNVSYFSFEDVSIASDESEMCAICLCPYEEGDIRIFSKRCPHAFHKECILEWLVKSHNECPCCRIEMVTKSEIEQMSASLIGTERLAQAMSMVNGSQMTEAPPFSGVRRSQLARQIAVARARTRELRQRASQAREPGAASMPLESPNAHWLWASRFNDGPVESPTRSTLSPGLSPGGLNTSFNSGPMAPRTPRSSNISTRFIRSSSNSSQPRTINPTRSSDAIMNPHEANQSNVAARQRADTAPDASLHDSNAGSLITTSSMYHDHWTRRSARRAQRRSTNQPVTLSPRRVHAHWRQNPMRANEAEVELPVTVLPPM